MNTHRPSGSVPGGRPEWNPANFNRHPVDEADARRMVEQMRDAIENTNDHNNNLQRDTTEARNEFDQKGEELIAWERSRRETSAGINELNIHLRDLKADLSKFQDEWRGLEATAASLRKTCVEMDNKAATLLSIIAAQDKEIQQQRGRWVTVMTSRIDHEYEGRRMEKLTEQLGTEHVVVAHVHAELETGMQQSQGYLAEIQKKYDQVARDVSTLEQLSELRVIGAQVHHLDRMLMTEEAQQELATVNEQLRNMENRMEEDQRYQEELRDDIKLLQNEYENRKNECELIAWS
ncbi:hypothetical protein BC937DRAFT_92457 [Endogone sp. FLAS-F59071]|nr:hypothetical protein BC937DRAFT_92457 [Endogone sp. FLAS-F59071]|eukprot:RUS15430.1 hypothetical protein BC937DRAFT_92457 [Endogone sp. FLAS-F59071]